MAATVTPRLAGAIQAVRESVALATDLPIDSIPPDDDLVDDLCLTELEREQVGLYLEGVFAVIIADELWDTPLYRTPAALAEWLIRKSEEASWSETRCGQHQRQRKRA